MWVCGQAGANENDDKDNDDKDNDDKDNDEQDGVQVVAVRRCGLAKRDIARWQWPCDDPRSLAPLGLGVVESVTITRPPRALKAQLPPWCRYLLPLADPLLGQFVTMTLFRANPAGRPGQASRPPGPGVRRGGRR